MGWSRNVRRRSLLLAVIAVLGGASANDTNEPAAANSPGPTEAAASPSPPSPSPPPPPDRPVAGARSYSQWSNSSDGMLLRRAMQPADEGAVNALMTAVGDWLDDHLEDLRLGGAGRLDVVAAPGLLDNADPALVGAATTDLASPDDPPVEAAYDLRVHHDGGPEWVTADATVTRHSGTVARAVFVFTSGDAGPLLVVFGPEAAP